MKCTPLSELGQRTVEPPISWLMQTALARPQLISLAAGFTDNPTMPVDLTRELFAAITRDPATGQSALQYGSTIGDPRLRALTSARMAELDSASPKAAAYDPARLMITHGSQQFLYMCMEALCDPGDMVLVEDPTYFVFLGILQSHGIQARGIPLRRDGLDLEKLEATMEALRKSGDLRRVKALYLVTYYHNPATVCTSAEKKRAALEILRKYESQAGHPIYLLEDAAYRELSFTGAAEKSALALPGGAERVIYAGTYSKPFATGIRVGWGMAPEQVFKNLLRIKGNHDFGSANLLQQLVAEAVESGKYVQQVARARINYARKAAAMGEAMRQHLPEAVEWDQPGGGLYFWARLPGRIRSGMKSALFQEALSQNVLYVPGQLCYADDPTRRKPDHEMRLSFGAATPENLREGIRRLGNALRSVGRAVRTRNRQTLAVK